MDSKHSLVLFNVSGPYAAGKDTLLEAIQQRYTSRIHRVSALTTRSISPSVDRYYESVSVEEFAVRTSHGNWIVNHQIGGSVGYAISIDEILLAVKDGLICIQSIFPGPLGAGKLREVFGAHLLSIGILVGKGDIRSQLLELEQRLLSRGRDNIEVVRARLQYQIEPIQYIMNNDEIITNDGALRVFDKIVFNDNLEEARQNILEIFANAFGLEG